ncbi:Phosphopantetheine adenylyltransferase 2 [Erysiphe neolycopersici]|uniref:Phosphopantetheine adenylyltransferase 2 n=1 Tax=Erysiphe neolycopersici TaxID=212602 RepID=A0A420HRP6_9PEZI|nr:Phosphopantetheine adenylyltransferase 2 [Erysiphe neolycopersici]
MPKSKCLLLLPPPPSKLSLKSISEAYRPSLKPSFTALEKISASTQLLIAVDWPVLRGQLGKPRSKLFYEAQKLLGRLYVLVYSICDEFGIEVDSDLPGSVDPRIVLIDNSDLESKSTIKSEPAPIIGPTFNLKALSNASNQWQLILSTNDDAGQELLSKYHEYTSKKDLSCKNQGGESSSSTTITPLDQTLQLNSRHHVVAVGGTFDHLHIGHKLLLTATALLLQPSASNSSNLRLIVGITGDELLVNKKYFEYINSWKQRQEDVVDFLLSILLYTFDTPSDSVIISSFHQPETNIFSVHVKIKACHTTIECIEIKDPFGPTITDEDITALVVSGETRSGGKVINQRRVENGIRPLEVYEIEVLSSKDALSDSTENFATKISSHLIRKRIAENT